MPDSKITALTALTSADPANDMFPIVDVSDTSMAASGTTKRISINNLLAASGTATLASATISGDLTVDTNVFKVDTTSNQVGIGTASPSYAADISIASVDGLRVKNTLATSAYFNRFHISNNTGINFIGYGASFSGGTILGLGAGSNSIFSDAAAPFGIATTVNQPLIFGINGSTAMTLNSTGLGVGASPLGTAAGRGNVTINGSTDAILALGNAGVLTGYVAQSTSGMDIVGVGATFVRIQTNGSARLLVDSAGNLIPTLQATAPSLGLNSQMVFNLTSNTNLRISVRGTDGVTRTADLTLA